MFPILIAVVFLDACLCKGFIILCTVSFFLLFCLNLCVLRDIQPSRNKSHLQIYQRVFKWVRRCKMSAEDRVASINKRRREIEGDRLWARALTLPYTDLMYLFDRTYTNLIACWDAANDPEQTDRMCSIEQDTWKSTSYLLIDLWRAHGEDNWGACTPPYLDSIHSLLEDELTAANIVLKSSNPSMILSTSIGASLHSITRRLSWGVKARMHGIRLLRMMPSHVWQRVWVNIPFWWSI